jgi:hypothetical protein
MTIGTFHILSTGNRNTRTDGHFSDDIPLNLAQTPFGCVLAESLSLGAG